MGLVNFLPIVTPQTFYLVESRADLRQVSEFINNVEQNFFRLRRPNGGSNEYYEAVMTMGTKTMGVRYVSPREGFVGLDGFVVSAFTVSSQKIVRLNLNFNPGESKENATHRWLVATQNALVQASLFAGLPYIGVEMLDPLLPPIPCGPQLESDQTRQAHHPVIPSNEVDWAYQQAL